MMTQTLTTNHLQIFVIAISMILMFIKIQSLMRNFQVGNSLNSFNMKFGNLRFDYINKLTSDLIYTIIFIFLL